MYMCICRFVSTYVHGSKIAGIQGRPCNVYTYTHTYTYNHTYIHTCIHSYIHTGTGLQGFKDGPGTQAQFLNPTDVAISKDKKVCLYVFVCKCVCVHMCVCVCVFVCMHEQFLNPIDVAISKDKKVCLYVFVCKCVCVHMCVCVHVCVCVYACAILEPHKRRDLKRQKGVFVCVCV